MHSGPDYPLLFWISFFSFFGLLNYRIRRGSQLRPLVHFLPLPEVAGSNPAFIPSFLSFSFRLRVYTRMFSVFLACVMFYGIITMVYLFVLT